MPHPTPTLLHIIPSLEAGGAERMVGDLAGAAVRRGHRVLVLSEGGRLVPALVAAGVEHGVWPVASKNPWQVWRNAVRLAEFIRQEKVDLVHVHSRAPAWSAYFACKKMRVPLITTFHAAYKGRGFFKTLYNSSMARGDAVIAASRFIASHIAQRYPFAAKNIHIIPCGIDRGVYGKGAVAPERLRQFCEANALPTTLPLILFPGRLTPIKGHEVALRALAQVQPPFLCLMVGPHQGRVAYYQQLLALTQELGLHDKVRFLEQADIPAAYAAASLVLSPSQVAEGFGRVAVEAQAAGIPVIATRLGATQETVLEGETGWLVPPGDVAALAAGITHALTLPEATKEKMARTAIARVADLFDVEQMADATLTLYAATLAKHHPPVVAPPGQTQMQ